MKTCSEPKAAAAMLSDLAIPRISEPEEITLALFGASDEASRHDPYPERAGKGQQGRRRTRPRRLGVELRRSEFGRGAHARTTALSSKALR